MRVLYDHSIFVLQKYGGISRYFAELIPRTAEAGVEVGLHMGLYINKYPLPAHRHQFARFSGRRRRPIPKTHRFALALSNWSLKRFSRRFSADIYHPTYYTDLLPGFRGKTVLTVHDFTHEHFPKAFPQVERTRREIRRAIERADAIICISENTRRDLLAFTGADASRVAVIHHGNSLGVVAGAQRPVQEPYLLYVGARHAYKNFPRLLLAFAQRSELRDQFILVCFGGGALTAGEAKQASELNVGAKIRVIDGDDQMLADLYAHARALIFPSLYEGFGMPMLEAMEYGCPIAASNSSSLPEIGGDAALYFDPTDIDHIAAQVLSVATDESVRGQLVATGKARVRKFTWAKCAQATADLYRSLM